MVAFPDARVEFADVGLGEAQHGGLANILEILASHPHCISDNAIVGVSAWAPSRLLFLLPCCVHLSLYARVHTPALCSARAPKARCQFGRDGKHDVSHVGSVNTDTGAFGYRRARHVAALPPPSSWCGHAGIRAVAYTRLWSDSGDSKGGGRTLTQRTSRRSACSVWM